MDIYIDNAKREAQSMASIPCCTQIADHFHLRSIGESICIVVATMDAAITARTAAAQDNHSSDGERSRGDSECENSQYAES